jgi:putative spermidine/putrescine transport system permease protein
VVVVASPFVGFALNAFSFRWFFPQLLPATWSVDAWRRLFSPRSQVPAALMNSIVLAVGVTFVSLVVGFPAARAIGMHRFRGRSVVEFVVLSPTMVPALAVGMGLAVTFLRLGLGGTLVGVGLVHLVPVLPYVVLSLTGIFANYTTAFEDQARTLGAGPVRVFLRITLPAVLPGIVVAGLFAFLISWSQYILTMLIGGGRVITLPVLLFSAIPGGDNAAIAVQSLLFIAPSIIMLAVTSRFLTGRSGAARGLGRL